MGVDVYDIIFLFFILFVHVQGRIQDFKLGGAHLKKLRRAEGCANIFGVFRVKNHDFTPKIPGDPTLPPHPPWIRPWCIPIVLYKGICLLSKAILVTETDL